MNETERNLGASNHQEDVMTAAETIKNALRDNPEVRLVLEVAARARALEENNPAVDLTPKNDVITIPNNVQCTIPR